MIFFGFFMNNVYFSVLKAEEFLFGYIINA